MELIIELDNIKDTSKKKLLLETLKFLHVEFKTSDEKQTIEEYNKELEDSDAEIENGNFITMDDLLKEMETW
ncbi:MAG: hypothetical protein ACTHK0_12960 [Ginsengibacter sp.]